MPSTTTGRLPVALLVAVLGGPLVRALSRELAGQTVASSAVDHAAAANQRSAGDRGGIGPHLAHRTDGSSAEGAEFAAEQVRGS